MAKMQGIEFNWIYIYAICTIGIVHVKSGALLTKCVPINTHLELDCGDTSIIYIRQTVISDYYVSLTPSDVCYLPPLNRYCHAFTNTTDIQFNGKHRSHYLFTSSRLSYYGDTYGECSVTSSSKVVQIQYECLSATERPSVCSDIDTIGDSEGFLMSPGFPDPVDRLYDGCNCQLTATDLGIIKLTAILINPIYAPQQEGGWELSVVVAGGEIIPLDKMHRYTTAIDIPYVSSLDVRYRSTGDSTYLPSLIPTIPPGFWIKYEPLSKHTRINVRCFDTSKKTEQISGGMLAIAIGTGVLLLLFIATIIYFGVKWASDKKARAKRKNASGHINAAAEIDFYPDPQGSRRDRHDFHTSNIELAYGVEGDSFFYRRCNTLPDLQLRNNSLPPNFIMRGGLKKYAMSDTCSIDSGFALSNGFGQDATGTYYSTLPRKSPRSQVDGQIGGYNTRRPEVSSSLIKLPTSPDMKYKFEEECEKSSGTGSGSYALSCATLANSRYDAVHTLSGITVDEVDV